jgi:AraC-like DNA-binding protein
VIEKPQKCSMPDGPDVAFCRLVESEFADVDALCSAVRDWDLDFSALGNPRDQASVGRIVQSISGDVVFGHARFSLNLEQRGAPPQGRLTFVVLEEDMQQLWLRGHDTEAHEILVFPVGSEFRSLSGSDFSIHTISVTEAFCDQVCETHRLHRPSAKTAPEFFRPPKSLLASLRSSLRLLRDSATGPPTAASDALAASLVRAWIDTMPGATPERSDGRAREIAMRRVLERMEGANWSNLNSGDLYDYSGVSERTLQYAFLERFGLTPGAFLKARRLAAVRTALKCSSGEFTLVGDLASEFGFWHAGQFARDYRRAFGELPSQTLRRPAA